MSQKVHVKSLRTNLLGGTGSPVAFYGEGANIHKAWANILRLRSYMFSIYGRGYVLKVMKAPSARTTKKPAYQLPMISMRMHANNMWVSPFLTPFAFKAGANRSSQQYLPISFSSAFTNTNQKKHLKKTKRSILKICYKHTFVLKYQIEST